MSGHLQTRVYCCIADKTLCVVQCLQGGGGGDGGGGGGDQVRGGPPGAPTNQEHQQGSTKRFVSIIFVLLIQSFYESV